MYVNEKTRELYNKLEESHNSYIMRVFRIWKLFASHMDGHRDAECWQSVRPGITYLNADVDHFIEYKWRKKRNIEYWV